MKRGHIGGQNLEEFKRNKPISLLDSRLVRDEHGKCYLSISSHAALTSLVFTSFVSYFICMEVQKATSESSCCPQPLVRPILTGVKGQVLWDGVRGRQETVTAEIIENHKLQFTK